MRLILVQENRIGLPNALIGGETIKEPQNTIIIYLAEVIISREKTLSY